MRLYTPYDHFIHIKYIDLNHNTVPVKQHTRTWVGDTHTLTQLTDKEGAQRGFLMVILNIYIDDMHRLQSLLLS